MRGGDRGDSTLSESSGDETSRSVGGLPGMSLTRFVPSSDARARMADRVGHLARRFSSAEGDGPPDSETLQMLADTQRVVLEAQDTADAALDEARALAVDLEQLRKRHDALEADHARLLAEHSALIADYEAGTTLLDDLRSDVDAGTARVRRVDEALKTLSRRVAESGTVLPQPERWRPSDGVEPQPAVRNEIDQSLIAVRGEAEEPRDPKLAAVLGELRSFGSRRSTRQSR